MKWDQILFAPEDDSGGGGDGGEGAAPPEGSTPPQEGSGGSLIPKGDTDTNPPPEGSPEGSGETTGDTAPKGDIPYSPFSIYEDGKVSEKFIESLPEEDRGLRKFFEKYAGAEDPNKAILQGIKNLQYLAGQKALEPLPEDAPDNVKQERQALLAKLQGAPEDPKGYGLDKPPEGFPESMDWPSEVADSYAQVFHKHGASPELVKDLMTMEAQTAQARETALQQQVQRNRDAEMDKLTQEFGDKKDQILQDAVRGGATLGLSREQVESIATSADVVKALANVVSIVSEDRLVDLQGGQGPIGQSYRDQALDIINNPNNPLYNAYHDTNHPQHGEAVKQRSRLNQLYHEKQKK